MRKTHIVLYFNSFIIKTMITAGLFEEREGFIVYGGIKIIDTIKKDYARPGQY